MDLGEVCFAGLGRGDVEDLACFVEGEAGGGEGGGGGTVALVCGGEFLGVLLGMGLKSDRRLVTIILVMLRPACMPLRMLVRRRGRR